MHITFYGAVREVTGSMHVLVTENDRILFDCGMYQGRRKEAAAKNKVIPFDPKMVTNIVLSHAHIDHSGRVPMLTKEGFSGRIVCTRATASVCEYLLKDSAHIQESDANYLNYKLVRNTLAEMKKSKGAKKISKRKLEEIKSTLKKSRHELDVATINEMIHRYHLDGVEPLYTMEDAEHSLSCFDGNPYQHPMTIGHDTTCTQYDAGHILGSAISIVRARENGQQFTIGFSGDLGRFDKPIIADPTLEFAEQDRKVDLLIMESTYGDRVHDPVRDLKPQLKKIIRETAERDGAIIIPAFAFGRTQELLYQLHELYDEGSVPALPVYVDSPLASKLTRVFAEHPEVYDEEAHDTFLEHGKNPFQFRQVNFVGSVQESMALNRDQNPHIVLSASGMCEAGRVLHHLRHKVHQAKNTVLLVGYMARNTLGRRIHDLGLEYAANGRRGPAPVLKLMGKEYPLNARVEKIGGFSGHGDRNEMLRFLKGSNLQIKRIALVHGEEEQSLAFADHLRNEGFDVVVPRMGETVSL